MKSGRRTNCRAISKASVTHHSLDQKDHRQSRDSFARLASYIRGVVPSTHAKSLAFTDIDRWSCNLFMPVSPWCNPSQRSARKESGHIRIKMLIHSLWGDSVQFSGLTSQNFPSSFWPTFRANRPFRPEFPPESEIGPKEMYQQLSNAMLIGFSQG